MIIRETYFWSEHIRQTSNCHVASKSRWVALEWRPCDATEWIKTWSHTYRKTCNAPWDVRSLREIPLQSLFSYHRTKRINQPHSYAWFDIYFALKMLPTSRSSEENSDRRCVCWFECSAKSRWKCPVNLAQYNEMNCELIMSVCK